MEEYSDKMLHQENFDSTIYNRLLEYIHDIVSKTLIKPVHNKVFKNRLEILTFYNSYLNYELNDRIYYRIRDIMYDWTVSYILFDETNPPVNNEINSILNELYTSYNNLKINDHDIFNITLQRAHFSNIISNQLIQNLYNSLKLIILQWVE